MNHVTSVACAVKKVIELNPFYCFFVCLFFSKGIFIFTHFAQNCTFVLGMKARVYVGQISDQKVEAVTEKNG